VVVQRFLRKWAFKEAFTRTFPTGRVGTDVMILKYFRPKIWREICRFQLKNTFSLLKMDRNICYREKRRNLRRKLSKIAESNDQSRWVGRRKRGSIFAARVNVPLCFFKQSDRY
jgi:crotonobetainyl-CoA:carnitine CoA-transferase CaiB-like acyl-CoA transferase